MSRKILDRIDLTARLLTPLRTVRAFHRATKCFRDFAGPAGEQQLTAGQDAGHLKPSIHPDELNELLLVMDRLERCSFPRAGSSSGADSGGRHAAAGLALLLLFAADNRNAISKKHLIGIRPANPATGSNGDCADHESADVLQLIAEGRRWIAGLYGFIQNSPVAELLAKQTVYVTGTGHFILGSIRDSAETAVADTLIAPTVTSVPERALIPNPTVKAELDEPPVLVPFSPSEKSGPPEANGAHHPDAAVPDPSTKKRPTARASRSAASTDKTPTASRKMPKRGEGGKFVSAR